MRGLVLIGIGLLVLGGGGAGAYFYFQHPAQAAVGASDEPAKAASHEGAHGGGAQAFVPLNPIMLPIIDEKGLNQIISLAVVIQVSDPEKAEEVKKMMPRLNDAYIQGMYGTLNKEAALRGGVLQIGLIKDRMNVITKRVLGDEIVGDVLIQAVQQRPM